MKHYPKANVSDPWVWIANTITTLGVISDRIDDTLDSLQLDDLDIAMLRAHDEIIEMLRILDRPR